MTDTPAPPPELDPPSPCVGICVVGSEDYCIGCFRTKPELQGWWTASREEKLAILERCRVRAASA